MILTTGDTMRVELPALTQNRVTARSTLKENERSLILRVLQDTGWRVRGLQGAAEILGIKPTTLEARMSKLGIKRKKGDAGTS